MDDLIITNKWIQGATKVAEEQSKILTDDEIRRAKGTENEKQFVPFMTPKINTDLINVDFWSYECKLIFTFCPLGCLNFSISYNNINDCSSSTFVALNPSV